MDRVQKILTGLVLAVCVLVVFFLGLVDLTPYLRPASAPLQGDLQADSPQSPETSNAPARQSPSPAKEETPAALETAAPQEAVLPAGAKLPPLAAGEKAPVVTEEKTLSAEIAEAPAPEKEDLTFSEKTDVPTQEEGPSFQGEANGPKVEKGKTGDAQSATPKASATEEPSAAPNLDAGKSHYPFSVLLASFKVQDRADRALAIYHGRGIDAYWVRVELEKKGTWYRVFAGHFRSRGDAESFRRKMEIQEARVKSTRFASLVGVFPPGQSADTLKKQLRSLGYCPYAISESDGVHRLYAGAFYTEEGAAALCSDLQERGVPCRPVQR